VLGFTPTLGQSGVATLDILFGHIVHNDGLLMDPRKIIAIIIMPVPINVTKIYSDF
jgi:hypothetical protein